MVLDQHVIFFNAGSNRGPVWTISRDEIRGKEAEEEEKRKGGPDEVDDNQL